MHANPRVQAENRNPARDDGWDELRARLPGDLDARARRSGAIQRPRQVRNGEQLLRLILIYVTGWFSLRDAAAWAGRALGIALTDDALSYRFSRAEVFLRELVQSLLRQQIGERKRPGPAVRILDATSLNQPGATGTELRLHATYTPGEGLVGVELTDAHGGEHIWRAEAKHGDLLLLDRGYGHAQEVRTAHSKNEDCLIRVHLQNLPVQSLDGKRRDPKMLVKQTEACGVLDQEVLLAEKGHDPAPARLVMSALPPEKAAQQRRKLRRAAAKKGRTPDKMALKLAGYFCCVTTVSAERVSSRVLFTWYRVRWQVELWFKRSKSLLGLDRLTKASSALVAVQVWGRLLVALLVQQLTPRPTDAPADADRPPISEWRLTHIHWVDVLVAIYGGASLAERLANVEALNRLRERRRKRTYGASLAAQIEQVINPRPTLAAR
jgi:Transposase DDE domain